MADTNVFSPSLNSNKKTCSRCGSEKPLSEFPKDNRRRGVRSARTGRGVGSFCNLCRSEMRKPGLLMERELHIALLLLGFKRCGKCKQFKTLRSFHKRTASNDGLAYKCTECVNSDSVQWRESNPGAHATWYQENKDHKAGYYKSWRERNKASLPARMAEWSKRNAGKVNAKNARRHAAKLAAVPSWANREAIDKIYAEAARLRRETGQRYEVDHIVPLQGKTVCGLHWEGNLQIILEFENISKHNRRWPGMLCEADAQ